jgi:hypothetical protein
MRRFEHRALCFCMWLGWDRAAMRIFDNYVYGDL